MYARTDPPQPQRRLGSDCGILAPPPGMDRRDGKTTTKSVNQLQTIFLSELILHYSEKKKEMNEWMTKNKARFEKAK
jgi:hypothetical protein